MWLVKTKEFTLLDWVIHFGIGVNIIVVLYILYYVFSH